DERGLPAPQGAARVARALSRGARGDTPDEWPRDEKRVCIMTNETNTNGASDRRDDPRLTAYVLDELAPDERAAFERELAADPALASEVRELERLSAGLRGALGASDAARLDDARRDEILRAAHRPEARPRRLVRRFAVAATVLGLLGGALWLGTRLTSRSG